MKLFLVSPQDTHQEQAKKLVKEPLAADGCLVE